MNEFLPVLDLPVGDRQWLVLHTRPRCEKKVADVCTRNAIPSYLPLHKKTHRYGARERAFWTPLFPGYVFGLASDQQKSYLSQNQYVANVLRVNDQKLLLWQLRQIEQALAGGDLVEVLPFLEQGKLVCVTGGPFKGVEGVVLRIKGKTKVVLNVDMIQQSIAVEVDSAFLKPA